MTHQFFSRERTGGITFGDFMEFLSVISKGTTMDKLTWAFTFYDVDNDGFITKEEMLKVTLVAFARGTQQPWVRFLAFPNFFPKNFLPEKFSQDNLILILLRLFDFTLLMRWTFKA